MKTKYGELEDYSYEDMLSYEATTNNIKIEGLDHRQQELLPWCPLFGELPECNYPADVQITRCIQVIEAARDLWGAYFPECPSELEDLILCDSWVESEKLRPYLPQEELILARNIFIEWEDIRGRTEELRKMPCGHHEFVAPDADGTTTLIPTYMGDQLSRTPEDIMIDWFEDLPSDIKFKELKAWQVFSILSIYEARKVFNISLYTHVPRHYYAKAKWDVIGDLEDRPDIVKHIQSAEDTLRRAQSLKPNPNTERGKKVLAGAQKSGEGRRMQVQEERQPVWDDWKERADKLWKINTALSLTAVAKRIKRQYEVKGESPVPSFETIRRHIKKPT